MPRLWIEVDGQPVPAEDVSWAIVAPCGCIPGVGLAVLPGGHLIAADIDTAKGEMWEHLNPSARQEREKQGYTVVAMRSDDAMAKHTAGCAHNPMHWVDPWPQKAGHEWVVVSTDPFRTARQHLAARSTITGEGLAEVTFVCGKSARQWSLRVGDAVVSDRGHCTKCSKAAS